MEKYLLTILAIASLATPAAARSFLRSRLGKTAFSNYLDSQNSNYLVSEKIAAGYVFSIANRNNATGSSVLTYTRFDDGTLEFLGSVPTGGYGIQSFFGSQNSLLVLPGSEYLAACNPGSNDFSLLRIPTNDSAFGTLPTLVGTFSSEGIFPNSIASSPTDPDLIYVLNAAGEGSIQGFRFDRESGEVLHLGGTSLFQNQTSPSIDPTTCASQVGFDPSGRFLAVTLQLNTADNLLGAKDDGGHILVFNVTSEGTPVLSDNFLQAGEGARADVPGTGPASFDCNEDSYMAVANLQNQSSSSFKILDDGTLEPLSLLVPALQRGTCWNKFVGGRNYAVNANNNSISEFSIDGDGFLTLEAAVSGDANARDGDLTFPFDLAGTPDSAFLYTLSVFSGRISVFRVGGLPDGGLEFVQSVTEGLFPVNAIDKEAVAGMAVV